MVIGNLRNIKYIETKSWNMHSNYYTVSMKITNFFWVESDRAIHKELNDTKFYTIWLCLVQCTLWKCKVIQNVWVFNGGTEEMVHPSKVLSKTQSLISLFRDLRTENNQMILVMHKNVLLAIIYFTPKILILLISIACFDMILIIRLRSCERRKLVWPWLNIKGAIICFTVVTNKPKHLIRLNGFS